MKRQRSDDEESKQQKFQTIRLGIKQYPVFKDINQFHLLNIRKHTHHQSQYALLLKDQSLFLFNHDFGRQQQIQQKQSNLTDYSLIKVNLRLDYRLPTLLHLKMKHSVNLQCIFILLSNGSFAVLNEQFYLLTVTGLGNQSGSNIKHCLDYQYFQKEGFRESKKIKRGFFLFLFTNSIEMHEVQVNTNHRLSKFKPSYKFQMIHIGWQIIDNQIKYPVKLHLFTFFKSQISPKQFQKESDHIVLVVHCSRQIKVYLIGKQTMKIQQKFKLSKIAESPAVIQDIVVSTRNKRIYLSVSNGLVKSYSYKQQNLGKMIMQVRVTDGPVPAIYLASPHRLLAYSHNAYLNLINLHTLAIQQRFKTGTYSQLQFINGQTFIGLGTHFNSIYNTSQRQQQQQYVKYLILNQLRIHFKKIYQHNSQVVDYFVEGENELLHFADHSLLVSRYSSEEVNVNIPTYLPPKTVIVYDIVRNLHQKEEFWILTEKSEIYKYCMKEKTVTTSQVLKLEHFIDRHDVQYKYVVTSLFFCSKIIPLYYDSEMTQKDYPAATHTYSQIKPLCLGTQSGEFLIVSSLFPNKIILKMKSLIAPITAITEILPIDDLDKSRGIIVYSSSKAKKIIIVEINSHSLPIQLYNLDLGKGWFRGITSSLLAVIRQQSFNLFYFKPDQNSICCFREQHYTPGLMGQSKLTTLSYNKQNCLQFLISGYSLGQIIIWKIETNNQQSCLHIYPLFLLQNSKQQPVQFAHFRFNNVYTNLGNFIICHKLPLLQQYDQSKYKVPNIKISKYNCLQQFNLIPKSNKIKFSHPVTSLTISPTKKQTLILPKLSKMVNRSARSSSLGILRSEANPKLDFMFHFPDNQLLRSLINKTYL